jgi:para-aminobenzoate synthetase component 1
VGNRNNHRLMTDASTPSLPADPLDILRRWPLDRPVVMLHSGRVHDRFARWSLIAEPREWSIDHGLASFKVIRKTTRGENAPSSPFGPGWIAALSYDLGRSCEPSAQHERGARDDRDWPPVHLARIDDAIVFDHGRRQWSAIGAARVPTGILEGPIRDDADDSFMNGELCSSLTRDEYAAAVERVLEYIRAGDVYQVTLSRRLSAGFAGSSRALARRALASSAPWYGAYLELPNDRAIISLSPELFLQVDGATRRVVTRPIKGTLATSRAARDLLRSEKDAAELHMIVDLMRNDLGRICETGSIRVVTPRTIESHPTVHHGVAEIEGVLREEAAIEDILRATFPPGSVTGAPKIRAMQIIDELEPCRRGPYCGSIGFFGDSGEITLNVAIRTMAISGARGPRRCDLFDDATLDYGTGGGIVADSRAAREWEETQEKAVILLRVLEAGHGAKKVLFVDD